MTPPTIKRRKVNAPAYPYDHRIKGKKTKAAVLAMIAAALKERALDAEIQAIMETARISVRHLIEKERMAERGQIWTAT